MKYDIILDADRWVERAKSAVLAFWRSQPPGFWRDSEEKSKEKPHPHYPTSSFVCAAILAEEGLTRLTNGAEPEFHWLAFLEELRRQELESFIHESEIGTLPNAGPRWNVYTASWGVRALTAIGRELGAPETGLSIEPDKVVELQQWIRHNVDAQTKAISTHLITFGGATLIDQSWGHPFLTMCALEAVERAAAFVPQLEPIWKSVLEEIPERAENEAKRIIASFALKSYTAGDLVALSYYARLLHKVDPQTHRNVVEYAVNLVCDSEASIAGWPLGRSLLYAPDGQGVQISSFHVAAALAELCHDLEWGSPPDPKVAELRENMVSHFFDISTNSMVKVKVDQSLLEGWCNNPAYGHQVVESWTTAFALLFFTRFRRYAQWRVQQEILQRYNTTWPWQMRDWVPWEALDDPEPEKGGLRFIEDRFINPVVSPISGGKLSLPSREDSNVSLILFGPPGTSKTTIVQALAKRLDWPLVSVTPSDFLKGGPDQIDSLAATVFSDFEKLERIVILFDECDELFRRRPASDTGTELSLAALVTGAMLPRLDKLHARGKLIFVITTNRIDIMDPAVVDRPGRFDWVIPVSPPSRAGRLQLLSQHGDVIPEQLHLSLADEMDRFSRAGVLQAVKYIGKFLRGDPEAQPQVVIAMLRSLKTEAKLQISRSDSEKFESQRSEYSRWMPSRGSWTQ